MNISKKKTSENEKRLFKKVVRFDGVCQRCQALSRNMEIAEGGTRKDA